ncbi:ATP synthase subunit a [Bienertia sinuspersici]
MMAGHSSVKILSGFAWTMLSMNDLLYFIGDLGPLFIVLALTGLELGVAILQAHVFTILICIYLNDAINLHQNSFLFIIEQKRELKVFIIFLFILFFSSLYFLFRFVFQPTRDLMAQPPLFFILLTAMGLGWLVDEIKHFRFIVRFLVSAFKLCSHKSEIGERLRWYRRCLLATWRLHCLLRQHDKDKDKKKKP